MPRKGHSVRSNLGSLGICRESLGSGFPGSSSEARLIFSSVPSISERASELR